MSIQYRSINNIQGIKNYDTSNVSSRNIVRELQKLRYENAQSRAEMIDALTQRDKIGGSPYLQDQPSYDPHRLKGTTHENNWKEVAHSQEGDLKQVQEQAKRRINII